MFTKSAEFINKTLIIRSRFPTAPIPMNIQAPAIAKGRRNTYVIRITMRGKSRVVHSDALYPRIVKV